MRIQHKIIDTKMQETESNVWTATANLALCLVNKLRYALNENVFCAKKYFVQKWVLCKNVFLCKKRIFWFFCGEKLYKRFFLGIRPGQQVEVCVEGNFIEVKELLKKKVPKRQSCKMSRILVTFLVFTKNHHFWGKLKIVLFQQQSPLLHKWTWQLKFNEIFQSPTPFWDCSRTFSRLRRTFLLLQ